jgi:DNA-binding NarL/FixJ family response regulator
MPVGSDGGRDERAVRGNPLQEGSGRKGAAAPRAASAEGERLMNQDCGPILVVDDHPELRSFVRDVLEAEGYEVIETDSGEEALSLAGAHRLSLVILDVNLPGTSGYALCSELRQRRGGRLPIIFMSGDHTEPFDRLAGLLIGADDYITKPFDPRELVNCVGGTIERTRVRPTSTRRADRYGLTSREREVLGLLVDGLPQVEIADRLYLSPKTVGAHIQRILGKMGVKSRTEAVALAAREGLLEPIT